MKEKLTHTCIRQQSTTLRQHWQTQYAARFVQSRHTIGEYGVYTHNKMYMLYMIYIYIYTHITEQTDDTVCTHTHTHTCGRKCVYNSIENTNAGIHNIGYIHTGMSDKKIHILEYVTNKIYTLKYVPKHTYQNIQHRKYTLQNTSCREYTHQNMSH